MPQRAKRPCKKCGAVTGNKPAYCDQCGVPHQSRAYDRTRGTSTQRGYGYRWQQYRLMILRRHPLCADPFSIHGKQTVLATEVDHIKPLREGGTNRPDNLQTLCKSCHSKKTANENETCGVRGGGFKSL